MRQVSKVSKVFKIFECPVPAGWTITSPPLNVNNKPEFFGITVIWFMAVDIIQLSPLPSELQNGPIVWLFKNPTRILGGIDQRYKPNSLEL